jgi:hypothetical protein
MELIAVRAPQHCRRACVACRCRSFGSTGLQNHRTELPHLQDQLGGPEHSCGLPALATRSRTLAIHRNEHQGTPASMLLFQMLYKKTKLIKIMKQQMSKP